VSSRVCKRQCFIQHICASGGQLSAGIGFVVVQQYLQLAVIAQTLALDLYWMGKQHAVCVPAGAAAQRTACRHAVRHAVSSGVAGWQCSKHDVCAAGGQLSAGIVQ
jgi:hypothetical protein